MWRGIDRSAGDDRPPESRKILTPFSAAPFTSWNKTGDQNLNGQSGRGDDGTVKGEKCSSYDGWGINLDKIVFRSSSRSWWMSYRRDRENGGDWGNILGPADEQLWTSYNSTAAFPLRISLKKHSSWLQQVSTTTTSSKRLQVTYQKKIDVSKTFRRRRLVSRHRLRAIQVRAAKTQVRIYLQRTSPTANVDDYEASHEIDVGTQFDILQQKYSIKSLFSTLTANPSHVCKGEPRNY